MSQNRDAPAYQEYAATILAQLPFRTMTLQDRGLLYTMRLECWVNVRLPHNHNDLAKVLGLPVAEVVGSLAAVMHFFAVVDGFLVSPELDNYRAHLIERKVKQSNGGKLGSAMTNSKRNRPAKNEGSELASTPSTHSRLTRQGEVESLVKASTEKLSQAKHSQNQPLESVIIVDSFVAEYEAAESCAAADYAKASGGG
ncbi:MAG: hypothetical protein Q8K83_04115 [Methylotenera sp.]|nr:hypothetical protein [Methylotenera sp.]